MPEAYSNRPLSFVREADPVTSYFRSILLAPILTRSEEASLANRIAAGDKRAILVLAGAGLPFVAEVCREYENRGLPLGELIGEGNLGLLRAASAYTAAPGTRFLPFSDWWIRQALTAAVAERAPAARLSATECARLRRVAAAYRKLTRQTGRLPTAASMELETGISADKVRSSLASLAALRAAGTDRLPHPFAGLFEEIRESAVVRWVEIGSALKRWWGRYPWQPAASVWDLRLPL